MKYIQLALWALVVLWQFKTINVINRLRLWRKTVNLFACFLAFTDSTRPYQQLRGAVLSAILSVLYDYETDLVPIPSAHFEDSLYLRFLKQEVGASSAYTPACKLFIADLTKTLSPDGLERGSVALEVYRALIQSEWMRQYASEDIAVFGRKLQIVDDILDLKEDAQVGDTNCFLGKEAETYRGELRAFLGSKFFQALAERSVIYRKFERVLRRNLGEKIPLNSSELIDTTRPITVIFSFVLTCLGFKLADAPMFPALLYGGVFAGITGGIMVFNDLCDSTRDIRKGKRIVHDYTEQVRSFYRKISMLTGVFLIWSIMLGWKSGLFALLTWVFGLLYSSANLRYPWNNLLVAGCSGAPVLVGMTYSGAFQVRPFFLFAVVFGMIAIREVFKDIEDTEADRGYKDTYPVRAGINQAALHAGRLGYPVVVIACCYPNTLVQLVPASFPFIVSGFYIGMQCYRATYGWRGGETYRWAQCAIDVFLAAYMTASWFTK